MGRCVRRRISGLPRGGMAGAIAEARPQLIGVALAVITVVSLIGLALWRPAVTVMLLGVFLFVQSALVRLDTIPDQLRMTLSRADEVVLAALVVRATAEYLVRRKAVPPTALWALVAFAAVGLVSALVNGVGPLATGVGLYLALKAGLWLYVASSLSVDTTTVMRYAHLVGALFVGVVVIAALQLLGLPMPWESSSRSGVVTAATSIWNQHTAFGGALTIAAGLSVAAFRLPGERLGGALLAVSSAAGILMSTARRLFVSLAVATVSALFALPSNERLRIRSWVGQIRRPAVLAVLVVAIGISGVVIGPRMADLAVITWNRYVVDLTHRDRYRLYEGAFRIVEKSPLVGRGPATYGSYASVVFHSPAYREIGYQRPNPAMVVGGQLGSLLAEYGILGFLAFASFLALLIRRLLPIARRASTVSAALATAGIFMITDMVVESVVNPVFSNSFITFYTFVGIGIALRLDASPQDTDGSTWVSGRLGARWRMGTAAAAALFFVALGILSAIAAR